MRKLLSMIAFTACTEAADPLLVDDGIPSANKPTHDDPADVLGEDLSLAVAAESSPSCAMLPDDGSACAHACDPDALQGFIPPGTCATFECELTDGTVIRVGGCRH
jgi:hypothetical protein